MIITLSDTLRYPWSPTKIQRDLFPQGQLDTSIVSINTDYQSFDSIT